MTHWLEITALDLGQWAEQRDAQGDLPRLVRRLVQSSISASAHVEFPAGEEVIRPGFDGLVSTAEESEFVPLGYSLWEMGVGQDPARKAQEDYRNSLKKIGAETTPAETTWVFVTPRTWPKAQEWATRKAKEGTWKTVCVIDGSRLEQWIERCPSVAVWFASRVGKMPPGVHSLDDWYLDWANATEPPLEGDVLLIGRDGAVERIVAWADSNQEQLLVAGATVDEALAFTMAALERNDRWSAISSALIVESLDAWLQLCSQESSLLLIPNTAVFEPHEFLRRAFQNSKRVILPVLDSATDVSDVVAVPPLDFEAVMATLLSAGIQEDRANQLASIGRRSTPAFRRLISLPGAIPTPAWALDSAIGRDIALGTLVGSWLVSNAEDRTLVAALVGCAEEDLGNRFLTCDHDPPFRQVGDAIKSVSPEENWRLLARYVAPADLESFALMAVDVLSRIDSRFDLDPDQRWHASLCPTDVAPSQILRRGIAESLALLGCLGGSVACQGSADPSSYVERVVWQLCDAAKKDWRLWASLGDLVIPLVEASPGLILDSLELCARSGDCDLAHLFSESRNPFFGPAPHVSILWALETASWSPEFLGMATLVLARLDVIDPGGRLANRPNESLRSVFHLWLPQTSADLDSRLQALDMLLSQVPEVGWRLLMSLLPEWHSAGQFNPRPKWRDWALSEAGRSGLAQPEHLRSIKAIFERALSHAENDPERFAELLESYPNLPPACRSAFRDKLHEFQCSDPVRLAAGGFWQKFRELIAHHRQFPNADWALPGEEMDLLEALEIKLRPKAAIDRHDWIFVDRPHLPSPERDFEARSKEILSVQDQAAREILEEVGIEGAIAFAARVKRPFLLGRSLGRCGLPSDEACLLVPALLDSADPCQANLALGFCSGKGHKWIAQAFATGCVDWTAEQKGKLSLLLPLDEETWRRIESLGAEVESVYWKSVNGLAAGREDVTREYVCTKLLQHGRAHTVIELLGPIVKKEVPMLAEKAIQALEALARGEAIVDPCLQGHDYWVSELIAALAELECTEVPRVAALEWTYLSVLEANRRTPLLLHREFWRSPDFFVEVLSCAYRECGQQRPAKEDSTQDQGRALQAYKLLDSWVTPPGTRDGGVDHDELAAWISESRKLASAAGRLAVADICIGRALSGSPVGEDGSWPHESIRACVEEIGSENLEQGLINGRFNARGIVSKDPREGGKQEHSIAKAFQRLAKQFALQWPRTSRAMQQLSERYASIAAEEDKRRDMRDEFES